MSISEKPAWPTCHCLMATPLLIKMLKRVDVVINSVFRHDETAGGDPVYQVFLASPKIDTHFGHGYTGQLCAVIYQDGSLSGGLSFRKDGDV